MAVIINNDKFLFEEDYPTRTGSQVDVRNLSDLFKQLGLEVWIQENLTRKETLNFLIDFSSDEAHAKADMMIFCMATHGPDRSTLMSADCREIDIETDILRSDKEFCYVSYVNRKNSYCFRSFNNENCPGLRGKPKFFIFQACQGQDTDYGVQIRGIKT